MSDAFGNHYTFLTIIIWRKNFLPVKCLIKSIWKLSVQSVHEIFMTSSVFHFGDDHQLHNILKIAVISMNLWKKNAYRIQRTTTWFQNKNDTCTNRAELVVFNIFDISEFVFPHIFSNKKEHVEITWQSFSMEHNKNITHVLWRAKQISEVALHHMTLRQSSHQKTSVLKTCRGHKCYNKDEGNDHWRATLYSESIIDLRLMTVP